MSSPLSGITVAAQTKPTYFSCCNTVCAMSGRLISYLASSSPLQILKDLVLRIQQYISACYNYWRTFAAQLASQTGCSHCKIRHISEESALVKMVKNAQKALNEHRSAAAFNEREAFATISEAALPVDILQDPVRLPPLQLSHAFAENIGRGRATMEDAHAFVDLGTGALTMVCDGHGGSEVSLYSVEQFQARFPAVLDAAQGNVHRAFERLIHEIHQEVASKSEWYYMGSTAVISYIDKASHRIYTATLGDSEATLYRNFPSGMKAIPLSPIRDWGCKKDAARAALALNNPQLAYLWPLIENTKHLRVYGLNVSRALGDLHCAGSSEAPAAIHKPKITVFQAKPGDKLVLACDGLRDYAGRSINISDMIIDTQNPEAKIVAEVNRHAAPRDLADALVQLGMGGMTNSAGDNITIVAVNIS